MPSLLETLCAAALDVALETLWPTRCVLCDRQGTLLCESCLDVLERIDQLKACPRCGSPYGLIQCCDCSRTLLEPLGRLEPPYDSCRSVCPMDENSGHIISVFKDAGEQRLSALIAALMYDCADHRIVDSVDAVTFIPCSEHAFRKRGFDHAALIANDFAAFAGLPVQPFFNRPASADQRRLSRRQRFANIGTSLDVADDAVPVERILVLDDAYTTGATMFAAADALRDCGVAAVHALTFARA